MAAASQHDDPASNRATPLFARPLDWTADPPGSRPASHLEAFRLLMLTSWTVQNWAWVARPLPDFAAFPVVPLWATAIVVTALLGGAAFARGARIGGFTMGRFACIVATPLVGWQVAWTLPFTANHSLLLFLVIALLAVLDSDDEDEGPLLLQTLRWMTAIVFFYAGLQKAVHGLFFQGEFLAWMIAHGVDRWGDVFGLVVSAEEVERLRSLPRFEPGSGPYRTGSPLFVLASNIVWFGEILIGLGLLTARFRHWSALAAIALTFTIQLAPREFMFAFAYTQLLLLSVRGDWNRRLLLFFVVMYAWMLAALLGAPGTFLLKPGGAGL